MHVGCINGQLAIDDFLILRVGGSVLCIWILLLLLSCNFISM